MTVQHLVVGHDQITGCEQVQETTVYKDVPVTWVHVNGSPWDILRVIEQQMVASGTALSITGMLWLDAVNTTSIAETKYVLERVSTLTNRFPFHTLSVAHVLYAPALKEKFEFIHM